MRPLSLRALAGALALAGLALLSTPRRGYAADEGEEGAKSLEEKLKAQMEKVLRLMRENQKALLEAARGSGKQPGPVDVPIPDDAGGMGGRGSDGGMVGGSPPEGGRPPEGGTPPPGERGEDIRKRMEEILKTSEQRGGAIPKELEELVRMIPRQSGSGQGGPPPPPGSPRKPGDQPKPEDEPKDGEKKDPKDGPKDERKPEDQRGNDKPPEGETGPKRNDDTPPWLLELPEEQRRIITGGSIEKVPERYRALVERYQKWLAERVKERQPR